MSLAMRTLCVVTAAALLAVALPVQAQENLSPGIYNPEDNPTNPSTPTKMYFHINGFQDFPVNTQPPSDEFAETPTLGLASHSACVPNMGQGSLASQSHHTWYGYSSPSYVEYDYTENGGPRIHQEKGISFDVKLDANVQPVVTWYLEAAWISPDSSTSFINGLPTVIPQAVLRATIREGDEVSVSHQEFNTGEVIAQAETAPTNLAGPLTETLNQHAPAALETVEYIEYQGKHLYKFTLPLDMGKDTINKDQSFNVRIDAFIDNVLCPEPDGYEGGDYLMLDYIRVHTSPNYRPMVEWNVVNPLRIEFLHPQFIGDDLVVHTSTNSPWGNYDVRGDRPIEGNALEVEITGPSPAVTFDRIALTARFHEHDHHTEAVDATWIWEYKKDGAKEGIYTVVFSAINDQEQASSRATAVATFEIGSGRVTGCGGQAKGGGQTDCKQDIMADGARAGSNEAPGVGLLVLLGTIAAAGTIARRRN